MAATVKGINLKLGITSEFQDEINDINKELKNTGKNLKEINKLTRFDKKNLSAFNDKAAELNKIIEVTEKQLKANNKRLKEAEKLFKVGKIGQDEFDQVKRAVVRSETNLAKFNGELKKTKQNIKDIKLKKFDDLSKKLKTLAGKFDKVAIAAGLALGAIVKVGVDVDTSFRKVSTLFGDVQVDTENLMDQIVELSKETGLSAVELNEGLYQALSAGVPITEDAEEAMKFLRTATELARGGFTTTESAVDVLSTVINSYGLEVEEAARISDILIATQNKGKTTVDELASTLANVIPIAAGMGVTFEDVTSALATMTAQGLPTAKATTQLKQLLVELSKSGTKTSDAFKLLSGKTFKDFIAEGGSLSDALGLMSNGLTLTESNLADVEAQTESYNDKIKKLRDDLELAELRQSEFNDTTKESTKLASQQRIDSLTKDIEDYSAELSDLLVLTSTSTTEFSDLFGSVEALGGALLLTGDGADLFDASLVAINDSAGTTEDALEALDGPAQTFKETLQTLTAIGIELSESLLPIVVGIAEFIQELADKFTGLNDSQKETLLIILGLIAALPIILTSLSILVILLKGLAIAGSILSLAFSPITLIIIGIALAIAAVVALGILLVKNWDTIKAKAKEIGGAISVTFELVKLAIVGAFTTAFEAVKTALISVGNFIINIFNVILGTISAVINAYIKGLNFLIEKANKIPGINISQIGEVDFSIPNIDLGASGNETTINNNNISFNISESGSPANTAKEVNRLLGSAL